VIQFPPVRFFRFSPGGVECDKDGLRLGDVALLAFEAKGGWTLRDDIELANDLSRIYGFPVDVGAKATPKNYRSTFVVRGAML